MNPLVRLEPGDAPALAMENELLRYEVTHLRARLAAAEERDQRREGEMQEWRERQERKAAQGEQPAEPGKPAKPGRPGKPGPDAQAGAARDDLVWLLQRIEATPVSRLLRRRVGYRRLVETYLRDGA